MKSFEKGRMNEGDDLFGGVCEKRAPPMLESQKGIKGSLNRESYWD